MDHDVWSQALGIGMNQLEDSFLIFTCFLHTLTLAHTHICWLYIYIYIYKYVQLWKYLARMAISTTWIGYNRTSWAPHSGKEWWKRMLDPALWERESLFFIFYMYIYICIYIFFYVLSWWCSLHQAQDCAKVSKGRSNLLPGGWGMKHLWEYCLLLTRRKRGHLVIWSLA